MLKSLFFFLFLISFSQINLATTYYSNYGSSTTVSLTVTSGSHSFEVNGIAINKNTEWYIDGVYKETDNSGILAIDPSYTYSFSVNGTTTIKAIVYNSDWTEKESHVWNATLPAPILSVDPELMPTGTASDTWTLYVDGVAKKTGTGTLSVETTTGAHTYYGKITLGSYSAITKTYSITVGANGTTASGNVYWNKVALEVQLNGTVVTSGFTIKVNGQSQSSPLTYTYIAEDASSIPIVATYTAQTVSNSPITKTVSYSILGISKQVFNFLTPPLLSVDPELTPTGTASDTWTLYVDGVSKKTGTGTLSVETTTGTHTYYGKIILGSYSAITKTYSITVGANGTTTSGNVYWNKVALEVQYNGTVINSGFTIDVNSQGQSSPLTYTYIADELSNVPITVTYKGSTITNTVSYSSFGISKQNFKFTSPPVLSVDPELMPTGQTSDSWGLYVDGSLKKSGTGTLSIESTMGSHTYYGKVTLGSYSATTKTYNTTVGDRGTTTSENVYWNKVALEVQINGVIVSSGYTLKVNGQVQSAPLTYTYIADDAANIPIEVSYTIQNATVSQTKTVSYSIFGIGKQTFTLDTPPIFSVTPELAPTGQANDPWGLYVDGTLKKLGNGALTTESSVGSHIYYGKITLGSYSAQTKNYNVTMGSSGTTTTGKVLWNKVPIEVRLDGNVISEGFTIAINGQNQSSPIAYTYIAEGSNNVTIAVSFNGETSSKVLSYNNSGIDKQIFTFFSPPVITVTPNSLNFENVFLGTVKTLSYNIKGNFLIGDVVVNAPDGFMVSLSENDQYTNQLTIPFSAQMDKTIWVRFSPSLVQTYTGKIVNSTTMGTPVNVSLSGNGIQSTISVEPTSLVFDQVQVGSSKTLTYKVIGNSLTNDLIVNSNNEFTISLEENGQYSNQINVPNNSGAVNKTIWVRFAPTQIQNYNENIINSSDGANSINVQLTGTGIPVPFITITYPNDNELLKSDSVFTIKWSANFTENVKIDLWQNDSYLNTICESIPNSGTYNCSLPNVIRGTQYKIRITSTVNPALYDESDKYFTFEYKPLAPTQLKASILENTKIRLTWEDPSDNENGFELKRKVNNTELKIIPNLKVNQIEYIDDSITVNNTYTYSIHSFNDAGESKESNECTISVTLVNDLTKIEGIPEGYYLSNNFPNPFNPSTNIEFGLPELSRVNIKVFDIKGREVQNILEGKELPAGNYSYKFDMAGLSSGIYLYLINTQSHNSNKSFKVIKKMILLK